MNSSLQNQLTQNFTALRGILNELTEDEINKVPFPESWTAAQVGDHLSKSYDVVGVLHGNIMQTTRPIDEKNKEIASVFLDFTTKLQSPGFIIPSNDRINKQELLKTLLARTSAIETFAGSEDLSVTCLDFDFPGMGTLTRSEWLYFIACHTQRHIHQLRNMLPHIISVTTKKIPV